MNEEQDLQGFESRKAEAADKSYMGTIAESADEPLGSPPRSRATSMFTTPRATSSV